MGVRNAHRAERPRLHALRDALLRAHRACERARKLCERPSRRDRAWRSIDLLAYGEGRTGEPELRLASRRARWRADESHLRRQTLLARARTKIARHPRGPPPTRAGIGIRGG